MGFKYYCSTIIAHAHPFVNNREKYCVQLHFPHLVFKLRRRRRSLYFRWLPAF